MSQPIPTWTIRAARKWLAGSNVPREPLARMFAAEFDKTGLVEAGYSNVVHKCEAIRDWPKTGISDCQYCVSLNDALTRATEVEDG